MCGKRDSTQSAHQEYNESCTRINIGLTSYLSLLVIANHSNDGPVDVAWNIRTQRIGKPKNIMMIRRSCCDRMISRVHAPTSGHYHYTHSYTSSYPAKATNRSTKGDKNDGTSIALFHTTTHYNTYTAHAIVV